MGTVEIGEKLAILAGAAKYDASCASSGSGETSGGLSGGRGGASFGLRVPAGVCHSWTEDGRCVSLLKVLFSNSCRFDCAYCVNRASADVPRSSFTVNELVELTCQFYRRNYIEGLFLSSGIFADPDIVMERLIITARTLRTQAGYGGYIHLKIIPGAGEKAIREAGRWADRLSANIELPTERSLSLLAPQKSGRVIFGAMEDFTALNRQFEEDRRRVRFLPQGRAGAPVFAPAGQSTQLIVGASAEDDRQIIGLSSALYRKYSLRRVYYSAYTPVGKGAPDPWVPASGGGEYRVSASGEDPRPRDAGPGAGTPGRGQDTGTEAGPAVAAASPGKAGPRGSPGAAASPGANPSGPGAGTPGWDQDTGTEAGPAGPAPGTPVPPGRPRSFPAPDPGSGPRWNGPPRAVLTREHRLYQADWLLRFYHFSAGEILDEAQPFLDSYLDPKTAWALRHLDFFPVEINRADYETLLRVPGIGAKTARRIIETRRSGSLSFDKLRRLGAVMKRARYFASCSGVLLDRPDDPRRIRRALSGGDGAGLQLPLFEF